MIKLCTQVNPEGFEKRLRLEDDITLLGSCFVDNISAKLRDASFHVHANPFGTLYNPASIANAVRLLDSQDVFTLEDCVQMGAGSEKICSLQHHTSFARESAEEFLAHANQALLQAREDWHKSRWVIITLGTAFVWTHDGAVVANCLKRPAKEFEHRLLSLDEICSCIRSISEGHDDKEFLFTVSPIRHMSLGAHANTLSKSLLHIALEQCGVPYFPAYEIVLDELRDYRFYAEDLVHPSPTAVEIIWERFLDSLTLPQERAQIERNEKESKASKHVRRT